MLNTANLPLPSPEDLQSFRLNAESMRAAVKLRATISAQVFLLKPEAMLAVAMQLFPGEDAHSAILKLHAEVDHVLRALAQFGEDVNSLVEAESERLAPMIAAAARRALQIPPKLEGIGRSLRFMDAATAEREANLRKAGVNNEDLQRLIADGAEERETHRSELNAQREALLAEQEALDMFLQTGDEQDLPEGFTVTAPLRISTSDVQRDSLTTGLRW